MNPVELKAAYENLILPHHRLPFHFFKNELAQHQIKAYNPLCGDKFTIFLALQNDKIETASFDGIGCALSRASLSILMREISRLSIDQILQSCTVFLEAIDSGDSDAVMDKNLKILVELVKQEGRKSCITLGWTSLHDYLATPPNQS